MKGKSSERFPTTIFDNNDDLEPETFSFGNSADSSSTSPFGYGSGGRDASTTIFDSTTSTVITSMDLESDEEDVVSASCDSKISSSKHIAEFEGETRFVCFSDGVTCDAGSG